MKFLHILPIIGILCLTNQSQCYAQTSDLKTYNTLTFFYIDNSEGYNSSALNSALNSEVGVEFTKKIGAVADKPDNYFMMIGSDGENPKQSTNAKSLRDSEWMRRYLSKTSREAEYGVEKQILRESLTNNPVKIKKEVDVYLFLSGFAMNQLVKKLNEFPTPVFFTKEMNIYLNNKDVNLNIVVYTNKEVVEKLTVNKIKSYFDFCNANLNSKEFDIQVLGF